MGSLFGDEAPDQAITPALADVTPEALNEYIDVYHKVASQSAIASRCGQHGCCTVRLIGKIGNQTLLPFNHPCCAHLKLVLFPNAVIYLNNQLQEHPAEALSC